MDGCLGGHHGLSCQSLGAPATDQRQGVEHGSKSLHDVIIGIGKRAIHVEAKRPDEGEVEHPEDASTNESGD
jgi:hypothetical protein